LHYAYVILFQHITNGHHSNGTGTENGLGRKAKMKATNANGFGQQDGAVNGYHGEQEQPHLRSGRRTLATETGKERLKNSGGGGKDPFLLSPPVQDRKNA
jgi:hypothetical protein